MPSNGIKTFESVRKTSPTFDLGERRYSAAGLPGLGAAVAMDSGPHDGSKVLGLRRFDHRAEDRGSGIRAAAPRATLRFELPIQKVASRRTIRDLVVPTSF